MTMRIFIVIALIVTQLKAESSSTCKEQGVSINPNDDSCQTYIFCFRLADGVFIEKLYSCPNGTIFNPSKENCDEKFQCNAATTIISTVTKVPKTDLECIAQGRFPIANDLTCTRYYFCYYLPSGKYLMKNYTCPSGSRFNPTLQTCTQTYTCNTFSTITSTTLSSSTEIPISFTCIKQGRFPVEDDLTCRSYHQCFYLSDGSFIEKTYFCPSTLKFDPKIQSCNANYQCPQSYLPSTTNSNIFDCPAIGRFPDDTDITCKTYFFCVQLPNGELGFHIYNCPKGEVFHPQLKNCSSTYTCNRSSSDSTTLSTTISMKADNCIKSGRFPVDGDETCRLYYLCVYAADGGFSQQIFICLKEQMFNPQTQNCTSNYQCSPSSLISSTETNNFVCPSSGRFPDQTDTTCRRYFYCIHLPNEDLGFQIFECPKGRNFDPQLKVCSDNYNCSKKYTLTSFTERIKTTTYSILTVPPLEKTSAIYLNTASNKSPLSTISTDIIANRTPLHSEVTSDITGISDTHRISSTLPGTSSNENVEISNTISTTDIQVTRAITQLNVTTSNTFIPTNSGNIICESVGNFPDLTDEKCESYFLCAANTNGEIIASQKKCELNKLFDPNLKECSFSYTCRCKSGCTSTYTPKESSEPVEYNSPVTTSRNTATSYIKYSSDSDYTTDTDIYARNTDDCAVMDGSSASDMNVNIPSDVPKTNSSTRNSSITTRIYASDETKHVVNDLCQSVGRFAIKEDETCRTYYLCVIGVNGILRSLRYSCEFGESFDPFLGKCSTNYKCNPVGNPQALLK